MSRIQQKNKWDILKWYSLKTSSVACKFKKAVGKFSATSIDKRGEPKNQNGSNPKSLRDQGEAMCKKEKRKRRGKIEKGKMWWNIFCEIFLEKMGDCFGALCSYKNGITG